MTPERKRAILTLVLALLVIITVSTPLYRSVFESGPFQTADTAGAEYVDASFQRALVAFALARATNAVISVIQDSEIDIAPAGIGVTIAIGEALDPINDMIERFSWVMLVSLVSLGMQKMLIEITPWVSVKLILMPALLLLVSGMWSRGEWRSTFRFYGMRLLFLAFVIRFCIPAMALVNDQVYRHFLDRHYEEAIVGIEQGNASLRNMDPMKDNLSSVEPEGIWYGIRKKAEKISEAVDLQNRIARMKARLSGMVENLLKMIAVFILNTVLLPVGFLWLLLRLFRTVAGSASLQRLERLLTTKMTGMDQAAVAGPSGSEALHPAGDGENVEVNKKDEDI